MGSTSMPEKHIATTGMNSPRRTPDTIIVKMVESGAAADNASEINIFHINEHVALTATNTRRPILT
jgi:hypothetical protein